MKKIFMSVLCLLTLGMPAVADNSVEQTETCEVVAEDYGALVKQYMELSHARDNMVKLMGSTYVQMKDNLGLTEGECMEMAAGITDLVYDDLVKASILIYHKYFTLEDMKELCKFMSTPVGQKFGKYNGEISTEVMTAVGPLQGKIQTYVMDFLSKKKK